jgi:hypothetical protein
MNGSTAIWTGNILKLEVGKTTQIFALNFRPLFQGDNDFMTCLKESFPQLKTRKLTRVEWCKIRRMMGKPRRCSPVSAQNNPRLKLF